MVGVPVFFVRMLALNRRGGGMVFGIRLEWDAGAGGGGNTVLQVYWDREIQFYSSTGTEKYSFTVLPG